ncbi:MAG: ATP-binding protein [Acidobacteriota bacterium]
MEALETSAVRLMVYRMVIILTFFLSALGIQAFLGAEAYLRPFYYIIAFVLAQNLLYTVIYLSARSLRDRPFFIIVQLFGDVLTVTLLALFTGGIQSIFTFLYHLLIVVAGYLLRKRGAFTMAVINALVYGLLCVALFYDWINPERLGGSFPYDRPTAESALYSLLANYVGFFLIAALITIMSGRLESTRKALGVMERDFTSLQSLNEQILSSLTWGVVTTDAQGRVTYSNPAAMRLLGETLPAGWDFDPHLAALGHRGRSALDPEAPEGRELELAVAGGERHLSIVTAPLRSGPSALGYLALIRDQTEVVKLREQLALKERLMATGAMAADIAHEIKNPLGSIFGAAQMLKRQAPDESSEHALLAIIQEESRRLTEILNNFLRYVKPPQIRRQPLDLTALAAEVVTLFRNDSANPSGLIVQLALPGHPVEVSADADRVRQALWNILTNARKAVKAEGVIRVSLTRSSLDAILEVEDNGEGMRNSQIPNYFQPFRRGFAQGSGLGLSVVYQIMEEHRGRVEIESALGRGTRCRLLFPLEAAHE